MATVSTLPTTPLEHPAMDYAFLRRESIRHLERLAGHLWTDFNAHDPGITILEQVCYALTDLAYRINYGLPDLLTTDGQDAQDAQDPYDSLYTPAQILTSHPVTLLDLRKLVIDVEGVKDAWVEKVTNPALPLYFDPTDCSLSLQEQSRTAESLSLKGLYRVLIEKSNLSDIDTDRVLSEVTQRLHACRNLGEDFAEIRILEPQKIEVHTRIEIGPVDNAEDVLLEVYQRIAQYISPTVRFASLSQLLAASKRVDEIFDGPWLEHGFLDSDALSHAQRKTDLRTSDLIREIMDVPGVRAVRDIFLKTGDVQEPWVLALDDPQQKRTPILDLKSSTISLERNQLKVSMDMDAVLAAYDQRLRNAPAFQTLALNERDLQPTPGRDRHVGAYTSFQHQFPATYGIGEMGLADSASPQRKAQAKQLKAYLLFFDQLIANYFAQLAQMQELFSFQDRTSATYFCQLIDDPTLGLEDIWVHDPKTRPKTGDKTHQMRLQDMTENAAGTASGIALQPALQRKNRFLNHLLARFAEQLSDYSLLLYGAMSQDGPAGTEKVTQKVAEKLVHDKQAFLQHYPYMSSARGTAFNYLLPWGPTNISGLEKRIRLKLGIGDPESQRSQDSKNSDEDFYVVEHILLRPMEGDREQQFALLADARRKDPYSLQLSFVFPNWPTRFQKPDFKEFVEITIREETPAHLLPQVVWLDAESMDAFRVAYTDWLDKRRQYWTHASDA